MDLKELLTVDKAQIAWEWLGKSGEIIDKSTAQINNIKKLSSLIFNKTSNSYENLQKPHQALNHQQQVQQQVQPQVQATKPSAEIEKDNKMMEILNNSPELLKIKDEILETKKINDKKEEDLIKVLEDLYNQNQNPNNTNIKYEQELEFLRNKINILESKIAFTPILEDDFEIPDLSEEQGEISLDIIEEKPLIINPIELEKPYNNKNYKNSGRKK